MSKLTREDLIDGIFTSYRKKSDVRADVLYRMQSLRQQKRLMITLSWSVIRLSLDVFCGML